MIPHSSVPVSTKISFSSFGMRRDFWIGCTTAK
jgi:hypothetical protein